MDKDVASLLLRQAMALQDEGIGPAYPETGDQGLINAAVEAVGDEIDRHQLWDCGLISSEEHAEDFCRWGSPMAMGKGCKHAMEDINYEKLRNVSRG